MPKKTITKKRYTPSIKEKYMCAKHKKFFTEELLKWKNDIIKSNNLGNILNSSDDNVSSADMVDQASSYTDKSVEMKSLNRNPVINIGKDPSNNLFIKESLEDNL